MAMYRTLAEHEANPPESWVVKKHGRKWALCSKDGHVMDTESTKAKAEALKTTGFLATLYAKEGRWLRGESVDGWRPYLPTNASK